MFGWIAGIKTVYNFVDRALTVNKEIKQAKVDKAVALEKEATKKEVAKLNAETKQVESLANLDKNIVASKKFTWLDDLIGFLIVITILGAFVLVFVPKFQPIMREGFAILGTVPDFVWYILITVITMTIGGTAMFKVVAGFLFGKK